MTTDRLSKNGSEYVLCRLEAGDAPLRVDPSSVACGFVLFPKEMSGILQELHIHEALLTNKTDLWTAVRRAKPSLPVYLMTTNQTICPTDAIAAIEAVGKYPDHSIAFDVMKMSPNGGRTLVDIYVGFAYQWQPREIVVAGPQMILPGQRQRSNSGEQIPSARSTSPQASVESPTPRPDAPASAQHKRWWQFWR